MIMPSLSTIKELDTLLAPHLTILKDYEPLGNTPFRLNAFNGVYAPAKTGKTYFVLEQLNTLDRDKYTVVWLDGDRNTELQNRFSNIYHKPLSNTAEGFGALVNSERRYDDFIFIIDSYKDFSFGYDTDSNQGSQSVFTAYQMLLDKGATIVIVFHTTEMHYKGQSTIKIKGNADTIKSKMDFLYELHRTKDNFFNLTVKCSREQDLNINDTISYANNNYIAEKIREVVKADPAISLRDLKKAKGLSSYSTAIDEAAGTIYEVVQETSTGAGRPKSVVKLINN